MKTRGQINDFLNSLSFSEGVYVIRRLLGELESVSQEVYSFDLRSQQATCKIGDLFRVIDHVSAERERLAKKFDEELARLDDAKRAMDEALGKASE